MSLTYIQLEQQLKAASTDISIQGNAVCNENFIRKTKIIEKWLEKTLQSNTGKIAALHKNQQTALQWQQVEHEALLIQAHLYLWKKGLKTLKISDWEDGGKEKELSLSPPLTASEEIHERIRQSKKLKLSLPHLEREIKKAETRCTALVAQIKKLQALTAEEGLENFLEGLRNSLGYRSPQITKKIQLAKKTEAKRPYHEFFSAAGIAIWVGKKAVDNDKLTFSYANGDDFWLHASGFPGSHIVIKCPKGKALDQETLEDALQLALAHSKAKNSLECEVIFTQCKYIKRFGKSAPGKVQVSKHQTLKVHYAKERLAHLKERANLHL